MARGSSALSDKSAQSATSWTCDEIRSLDTLYQSQKILGTMQILTGRCNKEIWTNGTACAVAGLLLLAMPVSAQEPADGWCAARTGWEAEPVGACAQDERRQSRPVRDLHAQHEVLPEPRRRSGATRLSSRPGDSTGSSGSTMAVSRPATSSRSSNAFDAPASVSWRSSSPSPIRPTTRSRGR
jgi:hypothetical protein